MLYAKTTHIPAHPLREMGRNDLIKLRRRIYEPLSIETHQSPIATDEGFNKITPHASTAILSSSCDNILVKI